MISPGTEFLHWLVCGAVVIVVSACVEAWHYWHRDEPLAAPRCDRIVRVDDWQAGQGRVRVP